jgi:peroxiredoxin Q/BCP
MLKEGSKAPDFTAKNQDGEEVSLSRFEGKNVVLYFYPKDDTPGCTTEAKELRDEHEEFKNLNAVVLGVSKDTAESHKKFINKYDLNFDLLVDPDLEIHEKYGTWGEKKMFGKTYKGTTRATFVIDGDGVIRKVFPKVKPKGHGEQVKKALAEIAD